VYRPALRGNPLRLDIVDDSRVCYGRSVTRFLVSVLVWSLRAILRPRAALVLENLALRQQLATCARGHKRQHVGPEERLFWVVLSKVWNGWRSTLFIVKPATVIGWHQRLCRGYWRWRSRKAGRPPISSEHAALIRRISTDHPEWGEDKIAEELAVKLGVRHSTSTIRKYMVRRRAPRGGQTWKTFIKNHAGQISAVDFLSQTTAFFAVVHVFVVMEIASRRIVLINVTTNPSLGWVQQQIRQATTWGKNPRFLLHDNDGIFGSTAIAGGVVSRVVATGADSTFGSRR
jgi:putative transposase